MVSTREGDGRRLGAATACHVDLSAFHLDSKIVSLALHPTSSHTHIELSTGVARRGVQSNNLGANEVVARRDARRDGEGLHALGVVEASDAPGGAVKPVLPDLEPFEVGNICLERARHTDSR